MGKKDPRVSRPPITDEAGVFHSGETGLYSSVSEVVIADLICEGEIEGIVSGEYRFQGQEGNVGYDDSKFTAYTALDENGNCKTDLGFLRSVYWNEVPVVDKDGFYNFQEVNLNWVKGIPQGEIPSLNDSLPNQANSKGSNDFELSVFRSLGDRLFGPSIDLSTPEKTPGYRSPKLVGNTNNDFNKAYGSEDFGGGGEEEVNNPPTLLGEIDRNAKVYNVLNKECVAVQVNIKISRLMETLFDDPYDNAIVPPQGKGRQSFFDKKEKHQSAQLTFGQGDQKARKIRYQIYTRPIYDTRNIITSSDTAKTPSAEDLFVPWKSIPDVDDVIFGKIEEPYLRSVEIDFRKGIWKKENPRDSKFYKYFQGWEIKIIRLTPDSVHSYLKNESFVDSIVEIYDSVIRYPYCSMVYSKFNAEFFSRLPSRAYETKLQKVKIPNTYDPILRTYTEPLGYWDGCFEARKEWTNNPAWCFYDLITNNRYGLGEYIDSDIVDKWTLYEIAKYCDVLVADGKGGLEPRFTLNHIITSREEAYKVVNDLASAFRAIVYFAFGGIYVSQDRPKLPIYLFNNSNVENGNFVYSSSAKRARHTVAIVRYNDKNNLYQPSICYTEDQLGIQRYGIKEIETSAIGCTSEGQAKRFGEWILRSEVLQTETVAFTAGNEGNYIRPGDVITIYDEFRNDRKLAGRTLKVEETATGVIPSGLYSTYDRADDDGSMLVTGNAIVIDRPIHFVPDTEYKLSILTPTNYYEVSQITPSNCVEDVTLETTTETEGESITEEIETVIDSPVNLFSLEDTLPKSPGMSLAGRLRDNFNDSIDNTDIFTTTKTISVAEGKAEFSFGFSSYQNGAEKKEYFDGKVRESSKPGFPKRIVIEDQDGNVIAETKYIGAETQSIMQLGGVRIARAQTQMREKAQRQMTHGEGAIREGAQVSTRRNGDIFDCLQFYSTDPDVSEETRSLAREEIAYLDIKKDVFSHRLPLGAKLRKTSNKSSENLLLINTAKQISLSFTKPAGVTSLVVKVIHPITAYVAAQDINKLPLFSRVEYRETTPSEPTSAFQDIFQFNHLKKTKTFETRTRTASETKSTTVETITVSADNTDEALTSADYPEIRKNQVQNIYFSGFQALPFTGNYHSDFSVSGSGIVTKIFFDSLHQSGLDFTGYSITGYNNSSVIGDLAAGNTGAYSSEYTNPDGANLIWSIEPRYKDKTRNRNYTLNDELASGEQQTFKVVNIIENDSKYDITAIEHNMEVYESTAPPVVDYGSSIGGPVENVRVDENDVEKPNETEEKKTPPPFEYDPSDKGACCVSNGDTNSCFNNLKRSECDELKGEFYKDRSCKDIQEEGICVKPTEITEPKPETPVDFTNERFFPMKFKLNINLGNFSPSQGLENAVARNYKIKPVNDEDVFGDMSTEANQQAALDYYNSLTYFTNRAEPFYFEYSEKTDEYGDFYLVDRKLAFDNESDAIAGSNLRYVVDDYCEHSQEYLESLGYVVVDRVFPASYGLRDLTKESLRTIEWDGSVTAKDKCNDPKDNTHIGHAFNGSYSSENIKNGNVYWVAPPNQKYKVLIQHALYVFPDFLRDDDGNVIPVERRDEATKDIRDFSFLSLSSNRQQENGKLAYQEGCLCDADDSYEPFADVNFEYTDAIVDKSEQAQKIVKNYADFAKLNFCGENYNEDFEFTFFPKTTFSNKAQYNSILEKGDKELLDYIHPGQYAMFTVSVSPEFDLDSAGEVLDCHDQNGYRYTFAVNLNDIPSLLPGEANTCNQSPAVILNHPEADNTRVHSKIAPKLYKTPKDYIDKNFVTVDDYTEKGISTSTYMPVEYPGKIKVTHDQDGNVVADDRTECLYVRGLETREDNDKRKYETEEGRGIDVNSDNSSKLTTSFTFGHGLNDSGLTMVDGYLAVNDCKEYNSVDLQGTTIKSYNVHIDLAPSFKHTQIASTSTSLFHEGNIEDNRSDNPSDPETGTEKIVPRRFSDQ